MNKNFGLLLLVFILAILAVWYFTKDNSSSSSSSSSKIDFPLGIGKKLATFNNIKSNFGDDEILKYADGKPVDSQYTTYHVGSTFPDGTPIPMSGKVFYTIFMNNQLNSFKNNPLFTDTNKMEQVTSTLTSLYTVTNIDDFNKIWNTLDPIVKTYCAYQNLGMIIFLQDALMDKVGYCVENSDKVGCKGCKGWCWSLYNVLNIDILNKKSKIGNGWDAYLVNAKITQDSDITPSGIIFGKKVKTIMMAVLTSEITTGAASQMKFVVNGTNYDVGDTTWIDDRSGRNYCIFVVPLVQDIVLNSLQIMVTCPGNSVTIENGTGGLCIVYA